MERDVPRLARKLWVRGRRLVRNAALDLRYGAWLGGTIRTEHAHTAATMAVNTDYAVMPQLFDGRVSRDDVLVEIGCGRGRVLNWWLHRGVGKRIVGIELDEGIAAATRERLRRHQRVEICCGDAVELVPADGTVLFMFNPFHEQVMVPFEAKLHALFGTRPHTTILYYAPEHRDVFDRAGRWRITDHEIAIPDAEFSPSLPRHRRLAVIRPSDRR